MKRVLLITFFCFFTLSAFSQLKSYELLRSYSIEDLEVFMEDLGVPSNVITPVYPVDIYKVLYNTPYKHPDSLVQASGAIAVPRTQNALPIAAYQHGTQAKKTNTASHLNGGQYEVGLLFASTGTIVSMTDYLGLGYSDPKVKIPPYIHYFSHGNTVVNMIRSTHQLIDSLDKKSNGQLFLFGYSQGGYATAAAHKMIEEEYADEFTVTASAPMSGPYDLIEAQVDVIISKEEYPTPGYLPYIVFSYQEMYPELLSEFTIEEVFKSPYDTLLYPIFTAGETSMGAINNMCTPVPRDMVHDSIMLDFENNLDHPLRQALALNDLTDWTPKAPIRLLYCEGDDQVTYKNAIKAYDKWKANGATQVEKQNFGPFNHNDCALFAFLDAQRFFNRFKNEWFVGIDEITGQDILAYPNPAQNQFTIEAENVSGIIIYDLLGAKMLEVATATTIDISDLQNGAYIYEVILESGQRVQGKLVVAQ